MAQFDVHRNVGKLKDAIPLVVVVQSAQFDDYRRRVVVPLVRATSTGKIGYARFNPTFRILGMNVVLHPLDIGSVPLEQLGPRVGSLSDDGQQIIAALDELLSQAWSGG